MGNIKFHIMPPQIKSKVAKAIAAANASKGKKKWSRGKLREKVNNLCLFNRDMYNKLLIEVPKYKMITTSILVDRLNISGSLARLAILELLHKTMITKIIAHKRQNIYTCTTNLQ